MTSRLTKAHLAWFLTVFIAIFFLGLFNRALVSETDIRPPDGTLVVAVNHKGISHPQWAEYDDGIWYAWGRPSCVWLDENKVLDDINRNARYNLPVLERLGLGRPYIDILIESQIYRPLTDYERERFEKKQACQADLTLYGQHTSVCDDEYLYPVEPGLTPPDYEIKALAPELLILEPYQNE